MSDDPREPGDEPGGGGGGGEGGGGGGGEEGGGGEGASDEHTGDDSTTADGVSTSADGSSTSADGGSTNASEASVERPGSTVGEPERATERPLGLPRWAAAVLPIAILLLLVGGILFAGPLLSELGSGEPVPEVSVSHHTVPDEGTIVLHVHNDGTEPVRIQQVLVDDAYWDHRVLQDGEEARTIAPGESARVEVPYHWQAGWDYHFGVVLERGAVVEHTIVAIQESPGLTRGLLGTLALVGLLVGVIPVALGMLWYPFVRTMERRWLHAVLAFAGGLLAFLAVDAGFEALTLAERVPGSLEGTLLVVLGALGAALGVQAIGAWREERTVGSASTDGGSDGSERGGGTNSGLYVAYLVALGIGLHNLAEGLAIGSSFALGRAALGSFLILGFTIHNVTEGPAVIAPVARERAERPALWHFVALGAIAGAPVILGGWIGSLAYSPTVGALFLAIGVGAIAQVCWELVGLIRADGGRVGSSTNLLAIVAGFAVMYATHLRVFL